jgi:hypothetical protein
MCYAIIKKEFGVNMEFEKKATATAGAGSLLLASVETAGIGLAKDLFFSGIDYAGGYIDGSQFGTQVGKAILGAGVNVGVGALFNGVGNFKEVTTIAGDGLETVTKVAELGGLKAVVGNDLMQNTLVKAGMSALQTYTSGVASGMVGAIGLLEMRLGGKDGFSMGIGSGGTDVSFGTVAAAMAGLKDAGKVIGAKLSGNIESISTLNAVNMLGWTGNDLNQKTAKDIWDGDLKVTYGDIGDEYGEYKIGSDGVTISKAMLGGGKEGSAKLATVMAHEGTHVAGNRIEAIAHLQGSGTYHAITAMFGLQGDDAFRGEMVEAILNPESWKENTGDTDYWKQVQRDDGTYGALPDGNHSLLDEDGNVLIRSPLDIFDENGKIIGHKIETENSYKRSFGMLMGLYPDFIQNDRTYAEYDTYVDAALADGSDSMLRTGINTAMAKKAEDGSIDVNAYLMTLVGVVSGEGIRHSVREMYDGSTNLRSCEILT